MTTQRSDGEHHCARCDEGILSAGHCVDIDGFAWHDCVATQQVTDRIDRRNRATAPRSDEAGLPVVGYRRRKSNGLAGAWLVSPSAENPSPYQSEHYADEPLTTLSAATSAVAAARAEGRQEALAEVKTFVTARFRGTRGRVEHETYAILAWVQDQHVAALSADGGE